MQKFFPTQLETYRNCPRKYFYSRDRAIRDKYAKASPAMVLGNAVHDALEAFFNIDKVKMSERSPERLDRLFREAWGGLGVFARNRYKQQEARTQAFAGNREDEAAWGKKGLDLLHRLVTSPRFDLKAQPLTSEQFFEAELAPGVMLGGKIDRIDRLPDGSIVVRDYKTGKPPSRDQREHLAKDDIQLAAYALITRRRFGKVTRAEYLYLASEDEPPGVPTSEEYLAAKEAEILDLCRRIVGDEKFAPTPNALCPWCDYKPLCPEGRAWEESHGKPATPVADDVPF